MQPSAIVKPPGYAELVTVLRDVLASSRERAEQLLAREAVRTYHALGVRVLAAKVLDNAAYGDQIFHALAEDIEIDERTLRHAVVFARTYPELPPEAEQLRWAHFRELLRISDGRTRRKLAREAARRGWTRARLSEAVRLARGEAPATTSKKPTLPRPEEATYVYKARVERVVDADTLLLMIDLGFQVLKEQRVRLAAIDAPRREEAKGAEAEAYVRKALAQVDFVIVKTNKIDLYGRYVGHVFYAPGETDAQAVFARGRYLNQELVEERLARPL